MKVKYDPNKHHRRSIRLKGYDYAQAGRYFVTFCVKDREHFFGEIINDEMHLNDAGIMIEKWYLELENKFPKIQCHEYIVMPNHFHAIIQIVDILGNHTISNETNNLNSPNMFDMGRGEPMCSPETSNEPNNMDSPKMSDAGRGEPMCSPKTSNESNTFDTGRGELMSSPEMSDESNNMDSPEMSDTTILPDIKSNHVIQGRHVGLPQQSAQPSLSQSKPILGEHKDSPLWEVVQWFKTMSTNEYIRGVKTLDWERFNGKLWQRNYYEHIIRNDESCERIATYIINNPKNWNNDSLH